MEGERLLTYDDKDLGSSKPAVSFRFFNIALSERRGSKMSWLGWDQRKWQSMSLVLLGFIKLSWCCHKDSFHDIIAGGLVRLSKSERKKKIWTPCPRGQCEAFWRTEIHREEVVTIPLTLTSRRSDSDPSLLEQYNIYQYNKKNSPKFNDYTRGKTGSKVSSLVWNGNSNQKQAQAADWKETAALSVPSYSDSLSAEEIESVWEQFTLC